MRPLCSPERAGAKRPNPAPPSPKFCHITIGSGAPLGARALGVSGRGLGCLPIKLLLPNRRRSANRCELVCWRDAGNSTLIRAVVVMGGTISRRPYYDGGSSKAPEMLVFATLPLDH